MKSALVTLLDDKFFVAFEAFITSLLENNPWFKEQNVPIVILDNNCSSKTKQQCKEYYSNIKFRKIKFSNYNEVDHSGTAQRLQCTFYKLDTFSIQNYDRLVFIDLDVVVLGDISELFSKYTSPMNGCPAFTLNKDRLRGDINSGVFVVNRIDRIGTYERLLNMAKNSKISMPDQKIINDYFGGELFHIDKKYNVEKRMLKSKKYTIDPIILHMVGGKDFMYGGEHEEGYEAIEKIWIDWYNKSKKLSGGVK